MSDDDLIRRGDALALTPFDCDGDPAGMFDNHVFVKRDAISRLPAVQPDPIGAERMRREVHGRVAKVLVASCRCGVKSFESDWHLDNCPYKVLSQVDGMVECIPGPTPADLLAEALALPEIKRLVEALEHEVKRNRRHLAASTMAALAVLKGGA